MGGPTGSRRLAVGPVYEFDEVFADPQVRHLGVVAEVDQPGYGRLRMLDFPVRASATPAAIRRPAPRLGEHTVEVLTDLVSRAPSRSRWPPPAAIALGR